MPEAERTAGLSNYEPNDHNADAIDQAGLFVSGVHQGLYIYGPVGTGKTRLACSVLNDIWRRGTSVRFIRVPELMVRLTPATADEDANDLITTLVAVPVLCLDDLGVMAGTDYTRRVLQTLADARLDRGGRTVWTSNLGLSDLSQFLDDERLPSRIVASCRIVRLDGPDQRTTRKARKPVEPSRDRLKGSRW